MSNIRNLTRAACCLLIGLATTGTRAQSKLEETVGKPLSIEKDIVYAEYERENVALDIIKPADATAKLPVVLYINGGGFRKGDKSEIFNEPFLVDSVASLLREGKAAIVSVEHRRAGRRTPIESLIEDIGTAIDWIAAQGETHGLDPAHIAIYGNGSGGYLGLISGLRDRPQSITGIISIGPVLDFVSVAEELAKNPDEGENKKNLRRLKIAFDGQQLDEARERYEAASPIRHLAATSPATLLIYSANDPLHRQVPAYEDKANEVGASIATTTLADVPADFPAPEEPAELAAEAQTALADTAQAIQAKLLDLLGTKAE